MIPRTTWSFDPHTVTAQNEGRLSNWATRLPGTCASVNLIPLFVQSQVFPYIRARLTARLQANHPSPDLEVWVRWSS